MDVYFIRHGHTKENGKGDKKRSLSPEGIKQVRSLNLPDFDLALCSDSKRTEQTAKLLCKKDVVPLKSIYLPVEAVDKETVKIISSLGNTSLASYLDEEKVFPILLDYGKKAWEDISNTINYQRSTENVLIVGHSILIAAIGLAAIIKQGGCPRKLAIKVLKNTFGECEGFVVKINFDGKISNVEIL